MGYNSKYTGSEVESLLEKAGTAIQEHQDISGKQDVIEDLDTIRSGAELGATALQSIPSEYVTETELTNKGYATTSFVNTALEGKVDKVTGKQLSTEDFTSDLKTKLEVLSNYDDAAIQEAVEGLQTQLNTLVSGDADTAIESFNEIIAFLEGVEDTETLDGIIASIEQQIAAKYSKPSGGIPKSDLESAVQTSLSKADTAIQEHQSLDGYVKDTDLATVATSGNYADLSNKPTIPTALSDLTADASHRTVTDTEKATWNAKSDFSGSYNDLSDKPSKLSQFENDVPFLENNSISNGVYIIDAEGNLCDISSWTAGSNATGVGLKTDLVSIIIAPDEWYTISGDSDGAWNGNVHSAWGGMSTLVDGCGTFSTVEAAKTDMSGATNTTAIISQLNGTQDSYSQYYTGAPAAEYCRSYSHGNRSAGEWYLPSVGEMNAIVSNAATIEEALTKIGGESFSTDDHKWTWTSSQSDADKAWFYHWTEGVFKSNVKNDTNGVRPVCSLKGGSITELVSELENSKQDILVSGTNIKTVNGESLLGSGDIVIEGGDYLPLTGGTITGNLTVDDGLYADTIYCRTYYSAYLSLDKYGFNYISDGGNISFNTLGDGTKFLSNDGSYKDVSNTTPIVSHGTSDTSFALTPNVYHKWGTVSSLSLTLATPSDQTILNEYIFEFVSGSTATSLTLPSTVQWASELTIEQNKTYQVSIIDNLGVIGGFSISSDSGGTSCCFVAGTQVLMADNTTKSIEDIVEGDRVISLNTETNELYETTVKQLITHPNTINMATVTLENGNSVTMHDYHPLYTTDGWKSLTGHKGFDILKSGDIIITNNGTSVVSNIERWVLEEPIITYNLNVVDDGEDPDVDINDNYFANGMCAHNAIEPC